MRFTYYKVQCAKRRTLKPKEKLERLETWAGNKKIKFNLENMQAIASRGKLA